MSDLAFSGIPGEAPDDVSPGNVPAAIENAALPTGTPMDLAAPDQPVDLTDPMAAGLAAFFEHQQAFRHPTPGLDTASAAPLEAPVVEPPTPTPAPEGTSRISAPAQPPAPAQAPVVEEGSAPGAPTSTEPLSTTPPVPAGDPESHPQQPAPDPQLAATPPVSPDASGLSAEPPASWVPAGHVIVGDRPIPETELPQLLRVYDWARSMPPELAQAIQDLQSGNFILTPRSAPAPYPANPSYGPPASGSGVPPSPDSSGAGWGQPPQQFDPSQSLDPQLAAQVNYLAQQQAQIQQQMQAQAQAQQLAQRQAFEAQVESARNLFAADPNRNLSAPEMHYLTDKVASMQMFPALLRQHGGDVSKAMVAAFDAAYWADENFRSRHTNGQVQQQVDQTMLANQDMQLKRQRAASLAGTSTPVSRTPPPAAPLTRESAANGMVSEIAAALSGGSPNGSN